MISKVASPWSPRTISIPVPPVMVSEPFPPRMMLSPLPEVMVSSPPMSGVTVKIWLTGRSTPSVLSPGPPPPRTVTTVPSELKYSTRPLSPKIKSFPAPATMASLPSPPKITKSMVELAALIVSLPASVFRTNVPSVRVPKFTVTSSLPSPVLRVVISLKSVVL